MPALAAHQSTNQNTPHPRHKTGRNGTWVDARLKRGKDLALRIKLAPRGGVALQVDLEQLEHVDVVLVLPTSPVDVWPGGRVDGKGAQKPEVIGG